MQLQMEVWNLDECDFLETTFDVYDSEEDFLKMELLIYPMIVNKKVLLFSYLMERNLFINMHL